MVALHALVLRLQHLALSLHLHRQPLVAGGERLHLQGKLAALAFVRAFHLRGERLMLPAKCFLLACQHFSVARISGVRSNCGCMRSIRLPKVSTVRWCGCIRVSSVRIFASWTLVHSHACSARASTAALRITYALPSRRNQMKSPSMRCFVASITSMSSLSPDIA